MDRIRAHGGEVIRYDHTIRLRPGRLSAEAVAWIKDHKADVMREVWPEYDAWEERAAIMEYDGGLSRAEAEAEAYRRVMR